MQRVAGFDGVTDKIVKTDMEHGLVQQVQEVVHSKLSQGPYLDKITLDACNEFLKRLDAGGSMVGATEPVDFLRWIKNLVTISTAAFFYGPNNPVETELSLVDQFWDFDAGIPGLLVGIVPSLTARKAFRGREAMVAGLARYLEAPEYKQAADITKERSEIARKFGVDTENIARSDLTFFFAGIINTSLTSFWMIVHAFAQPGLLSSIRSELENKIESPTLGSRSVVLSIKKVVRECDLLNACFKEVLRLYSDNFATRVVTSDTLLAEKYFLKKDSILQISGGIIHADSNIWGQDVASFQPQRFLSSASKPNLRHEEQSKKSKTIHPAAFRAFGGGATLCPGRHFALNEILGLVAMITLMFDISTINDEIICVPQKNDAVIPIHVLEPKTSLRARIRRRDEWLNKTLVLKI